MSIECRFCGMTNDDNAVRCEMCNSLLRDEILSTSSVANDTTSEKNEWRITCPKCGKVYIVTTQDDRIHECSNCEDELDRFEISHIAPVKVQVETTEQQSGKMKLVLNEIRKKTTIEITHDVVIDREQSEVAPDFFKSDQYISNPHCRFFFEGGNWQVEDLGSLNKTIVNSAELPAYFPTIIRDGGYIRLADLLFRVSIKPETTQVVKQVHDPTMNVIHEPDTASSNSENADIEVWAVRCPICGAHYQVKDATSRIEECPGACSEDEIDRYEIASCTPRRVKIGLIDVKWRLT